MERTSLRIQHRAELIAAFAALQGFDIPASDIAENMWVNAPGDVSIKALAKALETAGIKPKTVQRAKIQPESWPALSTVI